eukprot:6183239-Pleurochrysis_carterae.AAC.2
MRMSPVSSRPRRFWMSVPRRTSRVHRDIKPDNLLLDARDNVKLTDFGLSAILSKPGQKLKIPCGTPAYSAPEVISRREYDGRLTDAWSLGVVLYQMLHGTLPFINPTHICSGDYDLAASSASEEALDVIRKLLSNSAADRASLPTVLVHPWLQEWQELSKSRTVSRRLGITHTEPDPSLLLSLEERY